MNFTFEGEPKAIQSVRFANRGSFTVKYQPKQNTDWKGYIRLSAVSQLPAGFAVLDEAIAISVSFIFLPPKSMKKADLKNIELGKTVYKFTKPDLADNLCKGLLDALSGVVYRDDSLIAKVQSRKIYGITPRIELTVERLCAPVIEQDLFQPIPSFNF